MFADVFVWGGGFAGLAILVVIVAAVVGIVWAALRAFGVSPPPWAIHILWIVLIAFVAIVAIRLVASM